MGLADKFKELIGYPAEEYDDEEEGAYAPEAEVRSPVSSSPPVTMADTQAGQLVVARPRQFEEARLVVDHLKERRVIVLNLEGVARDLSCRILDFLAGAVYARDGHFERVAADAYVITPCGVQFMGGALGEGGLSEIRFSEFRASACG